MSMLNDAADFLTRTRDVVFANAPANMLFTFDQDEFVDMSAQQAGPLLRQDNDFWLFETEIDDTRRAGPSMVSPTRCYGSLLIKLYSKRPRDEVRGLRALEEVADWFADRTIQGIRFRTFLPLTTGKESGFTSYRGVITTDFEIRPKRTVL